LAKAALVTGGARRLGKDISLALAEAGFDIFMNYNTTSESIVKETADKISALGVKAYPLKADVSKADDIKSMFAEVGKERGCVDVLVNNAAIFRHYDFFDITEKDFDEFIDTNLKSVLFCSQEAARQMLKHKGSVRSIINISSLGGILNWTGYIPYSVSKTGVIKLTKLLAKKLAPDILVNSIAPGTILVDEDTNDNVDEREASKYPMKRFGTSSDITSIVKYLASENKYITGQIIAVDGGRSL
jgi:3-oxoacyl-[acyl-carrier protein] reductase